MPRTEFDIFQAYQVAGPNEGRLWAINFSRLPVPDLPFPAGHKSLYGFNAGFTRFMDRGNDPLSEPGLFGADRIAYAVAYFFWQHVDPGHHKYVHALRFHFQVHGLSGQSQLNDSGMVEDPTNLGESGIRRVGAGAQGLAQYSYEEDLDWASLPVDKRHPGATIEVFHFRRGSSGTVERQLLQRFVIPSRDPANPRLHWYYQDRGRVIAFHDTLGPAAKLVISAIHPAYGFRVQGIPTRGADTRN